MVKHITTTGAFLILTLAMVGTATADGFGSGGNTFDIEFVPIGNPGNPADTTGAPDPAGSVDYIYSMGKFEVSRDMITKANSEGGLGITLADMTSSGGNGVDRPATGVSWNEAARFVNWLNTSTGGTAAYKFTTSGVNDDIELWTPSDTLDYDPANPFRSIRAKYVLPSMDEWYKAAYYNPTTLMYGDYPSSDGTVPTAVASGTTDKTAVFSQPFSQGPADIDEAGGLSAYGVMGMGGNVFEWEETTEDLLNDSGSSARGFRGGSWGAASPSNLSASGRGSFGPTGEFSFVGFRVASLPSTVPLNDDWDNTIGIAGPDFTVMGTNVLATTQAGEQQLEFTGSTVWWFFINAQQNGTVTINTFGSDFDTQLHIYTGFELGFPNLIPVTNNDDTGGTGQSEVSFPVTAGTCYDVRVGGFKDSVVAEGNIVLNGAFFPLGDANGDGVLNNFDINPFVLALSFPTAYAIVYPGVDPDVVLDMNGDGVFNNFDISGFVSALTVP